VQNRPFFQSNLVDDLGLSTVDVKDRLDLGAAQWSLPAGAFLGGEPNHSTGYLSTTDITHKHDCPTICIKHSMNFPLEIDLLKKQMQNASQCSEVRRRIEDWSSCVALRIWIVSRRQRQCIEVGISSLQRCLSVG
jgi:hypothetical protein